VMDRGGLGVRRHGLDSGTADSDSNGDSNRPGR
jgi:hypothetical protein